MSNHLAELQALLDAANAPVVTTQRGLDPRLHEYQTRGVRHLWTNPRAGLFMDMGLGKTATVLQALTPDHLPALVVAPKRVAENVWRAEVAKWRPDLSVAIAAGTPAKRARAFEALADVTVIGRDNLTDVGPDHRFSTVVIDELSGYKNRSSKRWKHARKIVQQAGQVWGLTGTPAPNGLMNLWAQVALLDGGARLGTTLTKYRARYFTPGRQLPTGVIIEWNPRAEAQDRITEKINDICLSMDAADYLELPPVTHNIVEVPLDPKTTRVYEAMKETLVADLRGDGEGTVHAAANAAVATGKLSQIVAGFLYPDADDPDDAETADLHTGRVDAVAEIVAGTGSPVLVFYRFRHELARLKQAMPTARTIDESGVLDEWNQGRVPILLAHPASAGHGLNLQDGGHTLVWSTMPWSLEEYEQANARVARQGQTCPVVIHHLIAPATVDESILARLRDKISVQDAVSRALA